MNKGFFYAVLSVFFVSTSFVFVQHLLAYIPPELLMALWTLSAAAVSALILAFYNKSNPIKYFRKNWREGLILGALNFFATLFWVFSVKMLGAAISAFVLRFMTIFMIFLGLVFLKEKMSLIEAVGAMIAIMGAFLISYDSSSTITLGLIIGILAALAIAVHDFVGKKFAAKINPFALTHLRVSFSFMLLFSYTAIIGKVQTVPLKYLGLIAIGASLSAVMGYIFYFQSLKEIDFSKVAIIKTLEPFVVLVYAFILFRSLPNQTQLAGGVLIVGGVLISEISHFATNVFKSGVNIIKNGR